LTNLVSIVTRALMRRLTLLMTLPLTPTRHRAAVCGDL
jgi:hypothetical protein